MNPEDNENEDPKHDKELEAWIDPALEARIVALLLGEASDFEKADLERAMKEQPELSVFRDRIADANELLVSVESKTEGGKEPEACAWKLSPDRREAVLDHIRGKGAGAKTSDGSKVKTTEHRGWWRPLIVAAACVALLIAIAGLMFPVYNSRVAESAGSLSDAESRVDSTFSYAHSSDEPNATRANGRENPNVAYGPPGNNDQLASAQQRDGTSDREGKRNDGLLSSDGRLSGKFDANRDWADLSAPTPTAADTTIDPSKERSSLYATLDMATFDAPLADPRTTATDPNHLIEELRNTEVVPSLKPHLSYAAEFGESDEAPGTNAKGDLGVDLDAIRLEGGKAGFRGFGSDDTYSYDAVVNGHSLKFSLGSDFAYEDNVSAWAESSGPGSGLKDSKPGGPEQSPANAKVPPAGLSKNGAIAGGVSGGASQGQPGDFAEASVREKDGRLVANETALGEGAGQAPANRLQNAVSDHESAESVENYFKRESEKHKNLRTDHDSLLAATAELSKEPSDKQLQEQMESVEEELEIQTAKVEESRKKLSVAGRRADRTREYAAAKEQYQLKQAEMQQMRATYHTEKIDLAKAKNADSPAVAERKLSELKDGLKDQETEVEAARTKMNELIKKYRIVDYDIAGMRGPGGEMISQNRIVQDSRMQLFRTKDEIDDIKNHVEQLGDADAEKLVQFGDRLGVDTRRYLKLRSELGQATSEIGSGVASGKQRDSRILAAKQLDAEAQEEARAIKDRLNLQLKMAEHRLETATATSAEEVDDAIQKRLQGVEYAHAREAYLLERDTLKRMRASLPREAAEELARKAAKDKFQEIERLRREDEARKRAALGREVLAAAKPFSTFSLHVSDVSFKLAEAALLEKGEWPEASKIRVEEFVNAFDYGDPAASMADKIACKLEQAAHPFLQERNLLRISMRTAAAGRTQGQPLCLTILLDNSGSMEREDREASVLRAVESLASMLGKDDTVTLVGFARKSTLIADRFSGERAAAELVKLVANTPSEGGTNLEQALQLGADLAKRQYDAKAQNRVVLLTDGAVNLGNARPEELRKMIVNLRQTGIAFDACGVGADGFNDAILEALTREGDGRYDFLNRPEDADRGFVKQLAGALRPAASNVKIQVKFNPDRVTRYRLAGFEKHRLKKEDFRNDKVDAAEMAAEEAGVALYQVQVNPSGSGEIGEVFVRFRDMSTGHMVERSWTIPYTERVPNLESAAPSMQLAGAAGLFAEKLKGGALAEMIELDEMTPVMTSLRQRYGADKRVNNLIRMVERARSLSR